MTRYTVSVLQMLAAIITENERKVLITQGTRTVMSSGPCVCITRVLNYLLNCINLRQVTYLMSTALGHQACIWNNNLLLFYYYLSVG